jgi:hypothetical protein
MTDDQIILLTSLSGLFAAGMIGYLVGTWPRKPKVSDREFADAVAKQLAVNAKRAEQQRNYWLAEERRLNRPGEFVPPNPESPDPPANAGPETERRGREQSGPAAEEQNLNNTVWCPKCRATQPRHQHSETNYKCEACGVEFWVAARGYLIKPRVPCATPFLDKHAPKFAARARKPKPKKKGKK